MNTLPGLYSTYTTGDGDIATHARFASFFEQTNPIKAFVFNAQTYTVEGTEVTPIKEEDKQTDHNIAAEYIGPNTTNDISDTRVIFYHIDEFNGLSKQERILGGEYEKATDEDQIPLLPSFVDYYILCEIHELCHWALQQDEQPVDHTHSETWNAVLTDALAHSTDIPRTDPDFEYTFSDVDDLPVTVPDIDEEMPIPIHSHHTEEENGQEKVPTVTDINYQENTGN